MKTIFLDNPIRLQTLQKKYNIAHYTHVSTSIGYNDEVYFLFAEHEPERMFADSQANTRYSVIQCIVNWTDGSLIFDKCLDMGVHEMNYHFIQPIYTYLLLLGARTHQRKDGTFENNACIVNKRGKIHNSFCLGDGIENCIVTWDGRIITSYSDQGVSADTPHGKAGLVVWDSEGQRIWENKHRFIMDCYAMNIDEQQNLWYYYYTDFDLVRTDFQGERVYRPGIKGISKFLLTKGNQLICDGGYDNFERYYCMDIHPDKLGEAESVRFEYDARDLTIKTAVFRSSKAILTDESDNLYFKDVIYI